MKKETLPLKLFVLMMITKLKKKKRKRENDQKYDKSIEMIE